MIQVWYIYHKTSTSVPYVKILSHPFLDLNVNKAIAVDFVFQIVFCNNFVWNLSYLNFHVFWVLYWCIEIKVHDVKTTILSFWPGQGAVDVHFECDKVTCLCGDGVWIVDEITPYHYSCSFLFGFLGSYVTDKARICRSSVLQHFVVMKKFYCFCPFDPSNNFLH